MKSDFLLEIKRQSVHLMLGVVITVSIYYLKPLVGNLILAPLIIAIGIMIGLSRFKPNHGILDYILSELERWENIETVPFKGAIWFGIGIFFPILLVPLNVACSILMIFTIGDSMATLIGKSYGKHRIGNKSVEGSMAFMLFGSFGALIFLFADPILALKLTICGVLLELFPLVDDNFLIPFGLTILYILIQML